MSVDNFESLANRILSQCKHIRNNRPESIELGTLLKVLSDFTTYFEAIASTITPEARHEISRSFYPRWKNIFIGPTATPPSATTPTATIPTATTPTATTSTATAPSLINPLTTTLSTITNGTSSSDQKTDITVDPFILHSLATWVNSPSEFFNQGSYSPEGICGYILALEKSNRLYYPRLRFAQLRLYRLKRNWQYTTTKEFIELLNDRGFDLSLGTFTGWTRAGGTWDLFAKRWDYGSLLGTDVLPDHAKRFPKRDPKAVEARLVEQEHRGIKTAAKECNTAGTALWNHISGNSLLDIFVSENHTSRKRGPSQALTNQDRRPFHIDRSPVGFAPQTELNSSPVITEIRDAAEGGTVCVDRPTTRDLRGYEESQPDVENLQQPSPTPTLQATPRKGSSCGTTFAVNGYQGPLNGRTDKSAHNHHQTDCIHMRQSPPAQARIEYINTTRGNSSPVCTSDSAWPSRSVGHELSHDTQETPHHPQAPGGISSCSPATHSTAIQIHVTQSPSLYSRPDSWSHVPTQESSVQNLSSVQSRHHEPSHSAAETHHPHHNYPPPQPPTPQMASDTTVIQSQVSMASSSRASPESNSIIAQEPSSSPPSYQSSKACIASHSAPATSPNINLAPAKQGQLRPSITPPIPMAAETAGVLTGISANRSSLSEFHPEIAEPQDRGETNDISSYPHSQALQDRASTGANVNAHSTRNSAMTQGSSSPQPRSSASDVSKEGAPINTGPSPGPQPENVRLDGHCLSNEASRNSAFPQGPQSDVPTSRLSQWSPERMTIGSFLDPLSSSQHIPSTQQQWWALDPRLPYDFTDPRSNDAFPEPGVSLNMDTALDTSIDWDALGELLSQIPDTRGKEVFENSGDAAPL